MNDSQFLEGQNPNKTAIVPAVASTLEIRDDLSGRSGFDLGEIDDETLEEMLHKWIEIIEPKAREFGRETARQALGLFWAMQFPSEVLPTDKINEAVDTVLPPSPNGNQ